MVKQRIEPGLVVVGVADENAAARHPGAPDAAYAAQQSIDGPRALQVLVAGAADEAWHQSGVIGARTHRNELVRLSVALTRYRQPVPPQRGHPGCDAGSLIEFGPIVPHAETFAMVRIG